MAFWKAAGPYSEGVSHRFTDSSLRQIDPLGSSPASPGFILSIYLSINERLYYPSEWTRLKSRNHLSIYYLSLRQALGSRVVGGGRPSGAVSSGSQTDERRSAL